MPAFNWHPNANEDAGVKLLGFEDTPNSSQLIRDL